MKALELISDLIIVIFFLIWAIIVLAAAFQRPADMNEGFEDNFPEREIFDKDGKDINKQI